MTNKRFNWVLGSLALLLFAFFLRILMTFHFDDIKLWHEMDDLNQLKYISWSLEIYETDEGNYPLSKGLKETSNDIFRELFKRGIIRGEEIFSFPRHAIVLREPPKTLLHIADKNVGSPPDYAKALEAGENGYQLFVNLSEADPSSQPLACNYTVSNIVYSAIHGWYVPAKGLHPRIHRGRKIGVLFNDGLVRHVKAQPDGSVILGGTNLDSKGEAIRVLRPALLEGK